MVLCILAGIIIGITERFIQRVTADKARQAQPSDVSRVLYRGTAVRVIIVIGGLASGAIMLNETMFICLVISYLVTRFAVMFANLWNSLIRDRKP